MRRRQFIRLMAGATGASVLTSCRTERSNPVAARVLVLAFDGMDPSIVANLMEAKKLPNLSRLAKRGSFARLKTSSPPQTPVAFSTIISGADPGLHNVFDFIHRDPNPADVAAAVQPFFSTAEAIAPESQWTLSLGSWQLPLLGGSTKLLRRGPAFWDELVRHGINADIYYLPANFPPNQPEGPGRFRCISGMGTPDLNGSYGEFTLFTPDAPRTGRRVGGGRFAYLSMIGHHGIAELFGPTNFLRRPDGLGRKDTLKIQLPIVRDAENRVAKIVVGANVVLLNEGEWSSWLPVEFKTDIPGSTLLGFAGAPTSVSGMIRLFLKSVYPKFELYVSPINIDPLKPANTISEPDTFCKNLADRHGRFHTIGIPEDTKALSHGALDADQFLAQAKAAHLERVTQFRSALTDFDSGCLFFYFGTTDLVQHMFWREQDPQHPGHHLDHSQRYAKVIEDLYIETDNLVGEVLNQLDSQDTLIVFSDHGFNSFRRGFNLNTWLVNNGFMRLRGGAQHCDQEMFVETDWSQTRAYGLGMNGLYVNAAGREKFGKVKSRAKRHILDELRDKLLEVRDVDGSQIITQVEIVEDLYAGADPDIAPDLILGYNEGYRASWATVLGGVPKHLAQDNLDRWSGTHLISADLVPGMLFTNRPLAKEGPGIIDIAPTILAAFGLPPARGMSGNSFIDFGSHNN